MNIPDSRTSTKNGEVKKMQHYKIYQIQGEKNGIITADEPNNQLYQLVNIISKM